MSSDQPISGSVYLSPVLLSAGPRFLYKLGYSVTNPDNLDWGTFL